MFISNPSPIITGVSNFVVMREWFLKLNYLRPLLVIYDLALDLGLQSEE